MDLPLKSHSYHHTPGTRLGAVRQELVVGEIKPRLEQLAKKGMPGLRADARDDEECGTSRAWRNRDRLAVVGVFRPQGMPGGHGHREDVDGLH